MAMTRERYDKLQQEKAKQLSISKSGYRVVLTPHFEKSSNMTKDELSNVDKKNQSIEFDTIKDISIESSSSITTYPMVNGDTIADHMIRQPTSISISGTYSMYGNKPTTFKGEYDRLTNIETLFEEIKDKGVMCTIVTIERGNTSTSKQRFKIRNNMALTSISWTEEQSSLSFRFSFTEALAVEMQDIEVDYEDENVPAITDASALDFTDTLLDWNQVDEIIIYQLDSLGLMEKDFWLNFTYYLKSQGEAATNFAIGFGIGGVSAAIVGSIALAKIAAVVGTIPVAGWIVAGIAALGAIGGGIYALLKTLEKQKAAQDYVQPFKAYIDDKKAQQEYVRFETYIGNIHNQLEYLEDVLKVYGITSNEEQECMLYIDDTYYVFEFKKNNTQTTNNYVVWSCSITNVNDDAIDASITDLSGYALSDITQCNSSNFMFRTKSSGYYVYMINKDLIEVENTTYGSDEERQKAIQDCNNNLTSYCVFVSAINMDEFNEKLRELVIDSMKR